MPPSPVQEAVKTLLDGNRRLPLVLDNPACLRPPRGHAIVRLIEEPTEQIVVVNQRAAAVHRGVVLAKAEDVTEVGVGDRVIIETMSGHPSMQTPLFDVGGNLLTIVPCRPPDPSQFRDEEFVKRATRLEALQTIFRSKDRKHMPPKARAEADELESELSRMKRARRGKCRSRLFIPLRDLARGQGIIAVEVL